MTVFAQAYAFNGAVARLAASLADGDARVAYHADTCGTSTTHPGHCTLDCRCWCHGPIDEVAK